MHDGTKASADAVTWEVPIFHICHAEFPLRLPSMSDQLEFCSTLLMFLNPYLCPQHSLSPNPKLPLSPFLACFFHHVRLLNRASSLVHKRNSGGGRNSVLCNPLIPGFVYYRVVHRCVCRFRLRFNPYIFVGFSQRSAFLVCSYFSVVYLDVRDIACSPLCGFGMFGIFITVIYFTFDL